MHPSTFDEAKTEEASIVQLLKNGKAEIDESSGDLRRIIIDNSERDPSVEQTQEETNMSTKGRKKRKRKLVNNIDDNTAKEQSNSKEKKKKADTKSKKVAISH